MLFHFAVRHPKNRWCQFYQTLLESSWRLYRTFFSIQLCKINLKKFLVNFVRIIITLTPDIVNPFKRNYSYFGKKKYREYPRSVRPGFVLLPSMTNTTLCRPFQRLSLHPFPLLVDRLIRPPPQSHFVY